MWRALVAVGVVAVACSGQADPKRAAGRTDAAAGAGGPAGADGRDTGALAGASGNGGSSSASAGGTAGGGLPAGDAGLGTGDAGDAGVLAGFSWRTLPSLMTKRQNAMAAVVGETMYVLGGLNQSGLLADVERLDPAESTWTSAPSLPAPQCCAAAGALGTVIAVAGGYGPDGHTPTNALLLFDTTTGMWRSGPPMPTARANAMGAVWNGKFAVIGGGTEYGATVATGAIEIYDPVAGTWATSTLTVTPRAGGVAVVDSDRIYVIGGALQGSLYGDPITEIVTNDAVLAGPPLRKGRVQVAGGLLASGLAIAGGWTAALDTATAEGLFGTRAAWQSLPPMPTSRAGAAAAVIDGNLVVAGGGQYRGSWIYQDVVEALQAD